MSLDGAEMFCYNILVAFQLGYNRKSIQRLDYAGIKG